MDRTEQNRTVKDTHTETHTHRKEQVNNILIQQEYKIALKKKTKQLNKL